MILAFTLVALVLTLTPGADTALVLRTSVRSGPRAAVRCTLGICTGTMTWATLSAVGVSALVAASAVAYDVLRYGGACYLLGTFFLFYDARVKHFHAIWHLLVIAGSVCHFLGILHSVAWAH